MPEVVDDLVSSGHAALDTGDLARARAAFEAALANAPSAEASEGLARCVSLDADYPGAVDLYERAYTMYRDTENVVAAARVARAIAYLSAIYGDWAIMSGWLARVESMLSDITDPRRERAWLDIFHCFAQPDVDKSEPLLRDAIAVGRQHRDTSLEFDAVSVLGQLLVQAGRLDEGLVLQDEALAAACAGEVKDRIIVEGIFCGMFTSCELAHDIDRAQQWIRAADDIIRLRGGRSLSAFCRTHYGGILVAAGRWSEAETELTEAIRIFAGGRMPAHASPIVRLADLRVRQGRLEEAERLLDGLDQHPDATRPVAALHLARSDMDQARERLERALAAHPDGHPAVGSLLVILVDVLIASNDIGAATEAANRLRAIADGQQGAYLKASAAFARGRICVASGAADARACLSEALAGFTKAQMPLELARTRLELARALASENLKVAVAEAEAAHRSFERLEAARYVDAAAAFLRSLGAHVRVGPRGREALTKRETEVLGLLGHGLSNPQIAARLVISRKTAAHHVSRVLGKLGLHNRAEAAAYAARSTQEEQASG